MDRRREVPFRRSFSPLGVTVVKDPGKGKEVVEVRPKNGVGGTVDENEKRGHP